MQLFLNESFSFFLINRYTNIILSMTISIGRVQKNTSIIIPKNTYNFFKIYDSRSKVQQKKANVTQNFT